MRRAWNRAGDAWGIAVAGGAGWFGIRPFAHDGIMGGSDARWYVTVVADHLLQWRQGLGPAFVGQTEYAPAGGVMPLRIAPYLQHLTVALDFATGRSLSAYLLLNLALIVSAIAGGVSAYLCLRSLLPERRTEACLLAVLYCWCPGVIGLAYTGELFMSAMTWPYLPIVFTGVAWIGRSRRFSGWVMVAAGCAACWLAHPPIGLWVSLSAVFALVVRGVGGGGWTRADLRHAIGAGLIFMGLCGYVFVSVAALKPPETPPWSRSELLDAVRADFPAVLRPVSHDAGLISDLQLGWSLWAVLAAGFAAAWTRNRPGARPLAVAGLLLALLLLPVPWANAALWGVVPQWVIDATNTVPMQRLYPILAAATVTLAACTLSAGTPRARRRTAIILALAGGAVWSGSQLRPFYFRGGIFATPKRQSEEALLPQNLAFPRFSTGMLVQGNRFFSHGVMDYPMTQGILAPNARRYIVSNVAAVAPGFDHGPRREARTPAGRFEGLSVPGRTNWTRLTPTLILEPGAHYLLAMEIPDKHIRGVLQLAGDGFYREYVLPMSGEAFAFGVLPLSSRVIPLHAQSSRPLEISLNFISFDPDGTAARYQRFARYELIRYRPEDLPIRQKSLLPYVAAVRSPGPGWLETFRYYVPGWTATVNGRPAPVRPSWNGLVAVAVPAGESEVRLRYAPPLAVLGAYAAAWTTWAGLAILCVLRLRRTPKVVAGYP